MAGIPASAGLLLLNCYLRQARNYRDIAWFFDTRMYHSFVFTSSSSLRIQYRLFVSVISSTHPSPTHPRMASTACSTLPLRFARRLEQSQFALLSGSIVSAWRLFIDEIMDEIDIRQTLSRKAYSPLQPTPTQAEYVIASDRTSSPVPGLDDCTSWISRPRLDRYV